MPQHASSSPSRAAPNRRRPTLSSYLPPLLRQLLGESDGARADAPTSTDEAELLVIIGYGRVPAKIAKRVPIGLALTYASFWMSPADVTQANRLAAQGLVTWVNYPELGEPRLGRVEPRLLVDQAPQQLDGVLAVDAEAKRAWDDVKGAVMASAISRMITRVVAGYAAGAAAKGATKDEGKQIVAT